MIHKFRKFTLVERQQIGEILDEQGFQQSGACSNQECMVEVGQLLAVKKIVGGSIGKIENIYPVTLKIIDVKTGKIEAQVAKDFKGKKSKLLSEYIPEITYDLMHDAGYLKEREKKKGLLSRPVFWISSVLVASGAAVAYALYTKEEGGEDTQGEELDMSDFPFHDFVPPNQ